MVSVFNEATVISVFCDILVQIRKKEYERKFHSLSEEKNFRQTVMSIFSRLRKAVASYIFRLCLQSRFRLP